MTESDSIKKTGDSDIHPSTGSYHGLPAILATPYRTTNTRIGRFASPKRIFITAMLLHDAVRVLPQSVAWSNLPAVVSCSDAKIIALCLPESGYAPAGADIFISTTCHEEPYSQHPLER
ncbi:MAG: hypothetical protein ACK5NE_05090 [Brachymonas sp.]